MRLSPRGRRGSCISRYPGFALIAPVYYISDWTAHWSSTPLNMDLPRAKNPHSPELLFSFKFMVEVDYAFGVVARELASKHSTPLGLKGSGEYDSSLPARRRR